MEHPTGTKELLALCSSYKEGPQTFQSINKTSIFSMIQYNYSIKLNKKYSLHWTQCSVQHNYVPYKTLGFNTFTSVHIKLCSNKRVNLAPNHVNLCDSSEVSAAKVTRSCLLLSVQCSEQWTVRGFQIFFRDPRAGQGRGGARSGRGGGRVVSGGRYNCLQVGKSEKLRQLY